MRRPLSACAPALLTLLLATPLLQAQDETEGPGWYDVEVLIFANRAESAVLEERWEPLPTLNYPTRWQRLERRADLLADPREPIDLVTVEDTLPQPPLDLFWSQSLEALLQAAATQRGKRAPDFALEPLLDLRVPRPMVALPENRRDLRQQRRRIDASAGLEVLWHERWRQPIPAEDQSVPLLIESEQAFGDFPELQGSILLYSGRFLHIVANLWLNTDGSYLDNERATTGWHMPPPPTPPEETPTALPDFRIQPGPDFLRLAPATVYSAQETATEPATPAADPVAVAPARDASNTPDAPGEDPDAEARSDMMRAFLAGPQVDYPWRHAVLLQQRRRMRSGELHYIDHPLLGIVVRISPLEFQPFVSPQGRPLPPDMP